MYKMQQVLRTNRPLKTKEGNTIPLHTRVVVMKHVDEKNVRVKVADPSLNDLRGQRVVAAPGSFNTTSRGRPKKES